MPIKTIKELRCIKYFLNCLNFLMVKEIARGDKIALRSYKLSQSGAFTTGH